MKKGLLGLMAVLICASTLWAAERPGTPLSTTKTDSGVSSDALSKAVDNYVAEVRKDKGAFMLKDDVSGQQVNLTLDKIHKENAAVMAENKYFIHGVFKGSDGKSYDVDFILKPELIGNEIKVSDSFIHKVDGVERYQWQQDKDDWKRETAPTATRM